MECKLCGKIFNGQRGLSSHLRQTHNIKTVLEYKEYYDKYILNEDTTCPICKKHKRKFIAFDHGYASTCIGQKDENGKPLTCRFKWNNLNVEKARINSINAIKIRKETISEIDSSKTIYDIEKEKWYSTMNAKDENGKNKFNIVGKKVSEHHLTIDPNTGRSFGSIYARRAAKTRIDKIMENGKSLACNLSQKSANTVASTIMPDGRTKKEHMHEKQVNTITNTILPNGLSIAKDSAHRAYETKVQNGTFPKYYGYSKISQSIFIQLIRDLNLNFNRCFFAGNEKQFINSKEHCTHRIDFTYVNETNEPILMVEFQGNQYHIRESELETRKNDINPHGDLLIESYNKDQIKKQHITENYPNCKFFYIWEDTIESDVQNIKNCFSTLYPP